MVFETPNANLTAWATRWRSQPRAITILGSLALRRYTQAHSLALAATKPGRQPRNLNLKP